MDIKAKIFDFIHKRHPHAPAFHSYHSAQRILLLFESELHERNGQIKTLIKELQEDGKDVTAWGYVNKKASESAILRDYRVLSQADFNLFGLPKDYIRKDIANEHFDILLDLNIHDHTALHYINLYANADTRAGKKADEPYLNDFMVDIQGETDPAYLFDQLLNYLKMIKSVN